MGMVFDNYGATTMSLVKQLSKLYSVDCIYLKPSFINDEGKLCFSKQKNEINVVFNKNTFSLSYPHYLGEGSYLEELYSKEKEMLLKLIDNYSKYIPKGTYIFKTVEHGFNDEEMSDVIDKDIARPYNSVEILFDKHGLYTMSRCMAYSFLSGYDPFHAYSISMKNQRVKKI